MKSNLDSRVNGNERACCLDLYSTRQSIVQTSDMWHLFQTRVCPKSKFYFSGIIVALEKCWNPGKILPLAQQSFAPTDHHCLCILVAGCMVKTHKLTNIHSYFIRLDPSQKYKMYFFASHKL